MISNPTDITDTIANIAVLEHREHSRCRVYPQSISSTITLAANATANTFGSWTEIIPLETIAFAYEPVGMVIEKANAATSYLVQLGYSIAAGSDPTTAQILGERRTLLPTPVTKATELFDFYSQDCPANAKLWGRVKSASSAADELEVSVVVTRHQEISNPIAPLATWPWAT